MRKLLSFFLSITIATLFIVSCSRSSEVGLNPGDMAIDFSLPSLGGKPQKLSDFRGKLVLLNFWASWCIPCVAELPALERLYTRLKDKGFTVIGVGIDDTEDGLAQFQQKYGLAFPILVDSEGEIKSKYKIVGVPESFIIDPEGKLVLFLDKASGEPTVKIIGPREWDSPDVVNQLTELLPGQGK